MAGREPIGSPRPSLGHPGVQRMAAKDEEQGAAAAREKGAQGGGVAAWQAERGRAGQHEAAQGQPARGHACPAQHYSSRDDSQVCHHALVNVLCQVLAAKHSRACRGATGRPTGRAQGSAGRL